MFQDTGNLKGKYWLEIEEVAEPVVLLGKYLSRSRES